MRIIVFAERFEDGAWRHWQHLCTEEEVEAVVDSANAKAADRLQSQPSHLDYLTGAAYIFNVAFGPKENPKNGDTRVYGTVVDDIPIGIHAMFEKYLKLKTIGA